MSIFSKLFRTLLIAVFTPMVLAGILAYYYQNFTKKEVLETHDNLAKMMSISMAQYVENIGWRMAFTRALDPVSGDSKKGREVLQTALASNPDFLMFAVLDKNGKQLYASGPKLITDALGEIDLSLDESLPDIAQTKEASVSSFDIQLGLPIAEVVYPLNDGKFIFGIVSFFNFWARMQEQRIGSTGRVYLVHASGMVFTDDYHYVPFSEYDLNSAIESGERFIKKLRSDDGYTYIGAIEPSPISGSFVAVLQQKREAYNTINIVNSFVIFFIVAMATLSYFTALNFAEEIAKPVDSLIAGAVAVSSGDLSYRVPEEDNWEELDDLIRAFNVMTEYLQKYQDLKVKQQVSEMKEFFFKSVAHDLRAPVFGLQGYLDLLESGSLTKDEEREYISIMKKAAEDLAALLEDVLDASRLEAGMVTPEREDVNFEEALGKVFAGVNILASSKGLELKKDIESASPVYADRKMLSRILTNLISNAIKFTDSGSITAGYLEDAKNSIIYIKDTGIGIAEENLDAVFGRYYKEDAESKGYGLGLNISAQMVRAHNGEIEIESEQGKGTKITFLLPKKEA
ncbi:Signal transduction histidine kinase [Parelusimicrobium proximum]|uniref:ATP-binding protein n=1 Tax=Parelusimicrobium proximum TaxID=3228953 RepID=UPI003D1678DE